VQGYNESKQYPHTIWQIIPEGNLFLDVLGIFKFHSNTLTSSILPLHKITFFKKLFLVTPVQNFFFALQNISEGKY